MSDITQLESTGEFPILSEEELKARGDLIESLSPGQLIGLMVEMFGLKHTLTLIGWAIRWGIEGRTENGPEFRAKLKAAGLSRATAYRASLDFRRFSDQVERRFGVRVPDEVLTRRVKESELAQYYLADSRR